MADFRDAYGLAAPAEPAGGRAARPAPSRARASRRGAIEGSTRPRPARSAGARATRAARSSTAATGRSSPCPCRTTAPTSSRAARTATHGVDVARAGAKPQRQYHGKARGHHEWVTGVAHCGGRSVATCGADGRLCLWRSPPRARLVTADGAASLSVLLADAARPQLLLAAGYDGTARLFDVGGRRARARRAGWRPAAPPRAASAPPGTGRPAASATATAACSSTTSRPARGRGSSGSRRRGEFYIAAPPTHRSLSAQAPRGGGPLRRALRGRRPPRERPPGRPRAGLGRARPRRPARLDRARARGRAGPARPRGAALADTPSSRRAARTRRVCVVGPRAPDAPVHAFREHRTFYCPRRRRDLLHGAGDGALLCRDRRASTPERHGRDAAGLLAMAAVPRDWREGDAISAQATTRGAGGCAWGLGAGRAPCAASTRGRQPPCGRRRQRNDLGILNCIPHSHYVPTPVVEVEHESNASTSSPRRRSRRPSRRRGRRATRPRAASPRAARTVHLAQNAERETVTVLARDSLWPSTSELGFLLRVTTRKEDFRTGATPRGPARAQTSRVGVPPQT